MEVSNGYSSLVGAVLVLANAVVENENVGVIFKVKLSQNDLFNHTPTQEVQVQAGYAHTCHAGGSSLTSNKTRNHMASTR